MKRRSFLKRTSAASLVTLITPTSLIHAMRRTTEGTLEQSFKNPPAISRPFTWWHWMNGNISRKGITLDLEAMKRVGIGGVQCFNVGAGIPRGPIDYLSPEWVELTKHALNEAGRLGLEFDMHNCPGWSSTGGPWITPELAMQHVVWSETYVTGGNNIKVVLPKPTVVIDFYKDTYVIAYPTLAGEEQGNFRYIDNWQAKANFPGKGGAGNSFVEGLGVTADVDLPAGTAINPESVLDITRFMDADGNLNWAAPAGKWTIMRMGHSAVQRKNNSAPSSGSGLECDKYSRKAYEFHFDKLFENLMPLVKQWSSSIKIGLLVDSYEVGRQNWTPGLPEEFKQRRGYDFMKYLPAVAGRIITDINTTERFLWDFRKTHSDLMAENYHGYFAELCRKNGIVSYTEPYNNGPFDQMEVGSKVDINMGEFWVRGPHFYPSVKLAASIAHVYGQRVDNLQIVGAEAFTGDPAHSKWQEYPYAMKSQGDFMYTQGLNRFIFHRYAHQPHSTALPGMTMGPWGFHFDRTNTWFEQSKSWLTYAARCQSVLQQGLFCGDLLYFAGEDVPGDDLSMTVSSDPAPPQGYDWDWINSEALFKRVSIKNNQIVLPDGTTYKMLVLVPKEMMSIEVLRRLQELVNKGMILVGDAPVTTPGLGAYKQHNDELKSIVREIWGDSNNTSLTARNVGLGRVFRKQPLSQVLKTMAVQPDFQFSSKSGDAPVNYIHRTINGSEVYFVINRRRTNEEVNASFRITGKQPELWNPDTGEITPITLFEIADGRTIIPIQFDPCGSCFVVFRDSVHAKRLIAIDKDGQRLIGTQAFNDKPVGRYKDVTNNFTVTAWVKPESDDELRSKQGGTGKVGGRNISSFVFYPPAGEALYGKGHVSCGLTVARNGIAVVERSGEVPDVVLTFHIPISGWTHIALTYSSGVPSIYVNGKLIKTGEASGNLVHPGMEAYQQDYRAWLFEGDMKGLELSKNILSPDQIQLLANKEIPAYPEPVGVQLLAAQKGLLFWENGDYTLHNNDGKRLQVKVNEIKKPILLNGAWAVSFPPNLGAPAKVVLPQLGSLHKHKEDGVKYFSGTATYTKQFTVPGDIIGKNLFLDLGKVETMAIVKVNGKSLGMLWKPPFQVDVTSIIKPGANTLEVQVTNLWPNRLIGDEQLPQENEYGVPLTDGSGGFTPIGPIRQLPDWYLQDKPKPAGGRITFSAWKHFTKESPLLESGLVGPVVLRTAVHKVIDI